MIDFNNLKSIEGLIKLYSSASKPQKFGLIITIGFGLAIALFPYYFGNQTTQSVLREFFAEMSSKDVYHLLLLYASCFLAVIWVVAGISESNFVNKHYEKLTPEPPIQSSFLNLLVILSVSGLIYSSIASVMAYVIIYSLMLPIDIYFRYALADNAEKPIKKAERDKEVNRQILEEFKIYHLRYPMLAVAATRGLLTATAFVFLLISKNYSVPQSEIYEAFSCVLMVLCIAINEIFSWGYRLRLITRSRIYEAVQRQGNT
jgi:hypothetical protein